MRILMVDDEIDITFTLKTTLENTGFFQVDTFNDSTRALSMFKAGVYNLALLDIRMPKMNGFQLCRRLRKIDKNLKICFLTATELLYYRETDSDVIDDLGSDCFVSKPVNNEHIAARLKAILSQR
jgi:DNA-binding response OmpR family regulator